MASMTSLGRRDFESRERGAASSGKTRKPDQGPWPHCGPGRPSLPLRPSGSGKGCLLPRLSATPCCILGGRRWHRGSIIKSPGVGLSWPLPPGSLPVGLRPWSLPGSRPSLRRAFQEAVQMTVKNRGPARTAPAPLGLHLSRLAPFFFLGLIPRFCPSLFFRSPRLYNLRHVLCSGRPTPPLAGPPLPFAPGPSGLLARASPTDWRKASEKTLPPQGGTTWQRPNQSSRPTAP